jgi:hypothetical protein
VSALQDETSECDSTKKKIQFVTTKSKENPKMKTVTAFAIACILLLCGTSYAQTSSKCDSSMMKCCPHMSAQHRQLILWTSGDREVALKMVFMYTLNSKKQGWMDSVRLLIWGPSQKLLVEDSVLQAGLGKLKDAGVELYACKACADMYGIADKLSKLGVTVMYTGEMLADLQKQGWYILSL